MVSTPRVILFLQATRGFDRGLLAGIARYAWQHGPWTFYREPHGYFLPRSRTSTEELRAWKPNGAICPLNRRDLVEPLGIPWVAIDLNDYEGEIPGVLSDDQTAGRLAAEHLLGLGLEQFAFCGFEGMRWSNVRGKNFCEAIRNAGYEVDVYRPLRRQRVPWNREEPHVKKWLSQLPKPVGLFCANDDRSSNILHSCRSLGLGVPTDVAVLGVDDDEYVCELGNPPLSSVAMASDRAGYDLAELLQQQMRGQAKASGQRVLAPASGVSCRQSTELLMVRDAAVRRALRFIQENSGQAIRVKDVVEATELSHRTLNERFHREFGTSIMKHLTQARITHIATLLRETTLPIHEVAEMVGFSNDHHFARYFQRATGLSPRVYRRRHAPP
ncbi:MAG: DNA-binding transcriptional regulator [Planctomycetota bacterium]